MTNLAHIAETALLLLAAYMLGCIIGYAARRILHAGRGTRQVTAVAPVVAEPYRPRSTAARLAASVEDVPDDVKPVVAARPVAAPEKPVVEKPASRPRRKTKSSDSRPATLSEPRNGGADNLKQIKGIGPKIEASLQAMGIFHIDQIAGWSKAEAEWVEGQLAFKGRIRRERWVEQAAELGKVSVGA
ncbi:hypothetical protein [Devosia ginsengisoli]|uniref:NADH-quinone oxidoreductase subunit E n=1 Tax=Devosia ginsengisoli TaxID=400770 RepID=A0A5B8LP32_9HYPH|nr:hypothetical protein [Devosia ginsengisoli]QDZ09923.1 hypothetical protein FPZ08_03690 [Devosia ginsengisoli]